MATYSQFLGLKLNAPADPFQLSDFVANLQVLDASPGVFICTSANRPAWTPTQAGRMIFMTDLKQLSWYDGANWNDLRDSAPVFFASATLGTSVSAGGNPTYSVCTFTTPRPCALAIILTGTYQVSYNQVQEMWQNITLDGSSSGISGQGYTDRTFLGGVGTGQVYHTVTSLGLAASITAGSHTIGVNVNNQARTSAAITVKGARAMAFIALYNASNSL